VRAKPKGFALARAKNSNALVILFLLELFSKKLVRVQGLTGKKYFYLLPFKQE